MRAKVTLLIVLLLLSLVGFSQKTCTLTVLSQNKTSIPFIHILIKETQETVISDVNGGVVIQFGTQDSLTLELSAFGFDKKEEIIIVGVDKVIYLNETSITLGAVVLTAQYAESNPEKAVQKITIIDKKKIERMGAVNLKDVLTNEMNIRLSQDNILGAGISLQGVSGENVKILIDGVPVIGRLNGNVDLSQVNLNDIERIEIVEGPMSVNYGTNALAGVINLITKTNKGKKTNFKINSYYENIGNYNLDFNVFRSIKKHSLSLSGGRNYFDGWVDGDNIFGEHGKIANQSRYKSWKPKEQYFGKFSYAYKLKTGTLKYNLGYFKEKIINRGLPRSPYGETAFDDYYRTTRVDNSIILIKKLKKSKKIKTTLAYNDYLRKKNTFFKDLTTLEEQKTSNAGDQDTTKFSQWVLRSSFSTSKDSVKINYEIGIDFNVETAFGVRIKDKTQQMGDYATYVSMEYKPLKNTTIRPGVRYAYNTIYKAPLVPSINIRQKLGKFNIRGSYARGFRAPSLKELHFNFVDINHNIIGNENLIAEQSNNFSLSVSYKKRVKKTLFKINSSTFYNRIKNLITLAQGEGVQFSYINIGDYQTHGIQLSGTASYKHIKWGLGSSYIARYNYLSFNYDVKKFSYTPELKSNFNYDWVKRKMFVSFFYKFTGELLGFRINSTNEILQTYMESYHTADLSLGKKIWKEKAQIIIGSKNLFNVKNVNSVSQGSVHSGSNGSSPVAMGRTYFVKMILNLHSK